MFAALGRTIANSLNTALNFLNSFGTTFNWNNFGKSLGTGVRSFFENFDWKLTAHTFYTFINGFATAFNAAIQEIPFLKIGQNISEMVRNALGGINWDTVFDGMAYFGYQLLFSLPFVGFVCLLIFSFGGTHNRNLRNFARSYFCMFIIVVLLILILAAIGGFAYFYSY